MEDAKWEKFAALGGVAFVVLNVAAAIVQGEPPGSGDSNEEFLQWFVDSDTGIKAAALLGALSSIALLWWFGSLWRRMSRAEHGNHRLSIVAFGGLLGAGVLFGTWNAIVATVAIQADQVSADDAKFFYVLASTLLAGAAAFLVAFLAAVNALSLRTGFLPRWVTIFGFVPAALFLATTLATTTDADAFMLTGILGFVTWLIWTLAVSAHLWRTADDSVTRDDIYATVA